MVIVRLMGGMGNQLFQYATAFALSKKKNENLILDARFFDGYKLHGGYKLNSFNISSGVLSKEEEKKYPVWQANLLQRWPLLNVFFKKWLVEKNFTYQDNIYKAIYGQVLLGYWQSYRYFEDYREEILKQFSLKIVPGALAEKISKEIKLENSVAVHVRRGDYLSNPSAFKVHGICSVDYYEKAVALVIEKNPDAIFYVFSDDIEWVRKSEGFNKLCGKIVFIESESAEIDLWLMTQAKHHIIANSTFSWWGAWLANHSKNGLVICPTPWFDDGKFSEVDLVPESWVKIAKNG